MNFIEKADITLILTCAPEYCKPKLQHTKFMPRQPACQVLVRQTALAVTAGRGGRQIQYLV